MRFGKLQTATEFSVHPLLDQTINFPLCLPLVKILQCRQGSRSLRCSCLPTLCSTGWMAHCTVQGLTSVLVGVQWVLSGQGSCQVCAGGSSDTLTLTGDQALQPSRGAPWYKQFCLPLVPGRLHLTWVNSVPFTTVSLPVRWAWWGRLAAELVERRPYASEH